MSTNESHELLKAVDAQTTEQELIEVYKTWSQTYDKVSSKKYIIIHVIRNYIFTFGVIPS
jgi:hypothetical protein